MRARASNVIIGTVTLALIAGSIGAFLTYQKLAGIKQQVPFRVIFEGSASGLRKGGSVNFSGIRVGEVVSLKLDHPRRVVALAMIDGNTPVKSDTQVGLEFQGLTGIAAISFTGGSDEAPPPSSARVAIVYWPAGTRTNGVIPAAFAAIEICMAMSRSIVPCSRSMNSQS